MNLAHAAELVACAETLTFDDGIPLFIPTLLGRQTKEADKRGWIVRLQPTKDLGIDDLQTICKKAVELGAHFATFGAEALDGYLEFS